MTSPNPTYVLSQINRIEAEMVTDWGAVGEQEIAEVQRRMDAAREQLLPRPGLLRRIFNATGE
jgi:hypothetical protein